MSAVDWFAVGLLVGSVTALAAVVILLRLTRSQRVRPKPISQRAIAQVHQIYEDGSSITLIENIKEDTDGSAQAV